MISLNAQFLCNASPWSVCHPHSENPRCLTLICVCWWSLVEKIQISVWQGHSYTLNIFWSCSWAYILLLLSLAEALFFCPMSCKSIKAWKTPMTLIQHTHGPGMDTKDLIKSGPLMECIGGSILPPIYCPASAALESRLSTMLCQHSYQI